jgi:hypothetical protein
MSIDRKRSGKLTDLFLEVRISTSKLIVDIAGEIFEAGGGQRGQLLTGLIPLWMEVVSKGQERDCVAYEMRWQG